MDAELIATGTELMLGTTVDTNSAWIARQLGAVGVAVRRITLVGDDLPALVRAIREAWQRADLVLCTGGLGPTADDLTREAVAEALDRPLEFHQALLDEIAARFQSFGRQMSPSNRQQAFAPIGARLVPNARGTAPSFLVEADSHALMVFPGVPSEMRFLVETALLPYLREERGLRTATVIRIVYLTGTSEAEAGELIADLMRAPYPVVGISAKAAQYEVRIAAQHADPAQAEQDAEAVAAEVCRRLERYVLPRGPLEVEVSSLLAERQLSLALYEGMRTAPIHAALARTPGALDAVRGVTIHPLDTAVDSAGAAALARSAAEEVREAWRADIGLAVQPGNVEPDGWTTIQIALADAQGTVTAQRRVDQRSHDADAFIATAALDLLRRRLPGPPR